MQNLMLHCDGNIYIDEIRLDKEILSTPLRIVTPKKVGKAKFRNQDFYCI
jgi:hypothetical protein